MGVLPRAGDVDRVQHPKLLLADGVGLRRARETDGGSGRGEQCGQHRGQGAGPARPGAQHPGLPGQCGTGGGAPSR